MDHFTGGIPAGQVRKERLAGCQSALSDRALPPPVIWDSPDSKLSALDAALALRIAHPDVTALICNGDMVALGACLALARLGLVAGKDMSVIGFDDISDAAVATPPLTTLAISPNQLGRRLASVLLDQIREPEMPAVNVKVPAQLVVSATTGPA